MKTTVNKNQFIHAFTDMGRGNQFSRGALCALFDYLEQLEDDTGEEIELDVIALCCDYAEHANAVEAANEYGEEPDADETDEDAREEAALDWLRERTQVIEFNGGVVVQNF